MEIDIVILEAVSGLLVSAAGGIVVYVKKQFKVLDETRKELTEAKVRIAKLEERVAYYGLHSRKSKKHKRYEADEEFNAERGD